MMYKRLVLMELIPCCRYRFESYRLNWNGKMRPQISIGIEFPANRAGSDFTETRFDWDLDWKLNVEYKQAVQNCNFAFCSWNFQLLVSEIQ